MKPLLAVAVPVAVFRPDPATRAGTPVTDAYQGPVALTGVIDKVTIALTGRAEAGKNASDAVRASR